MLIRLSLAITFAAALACAQSIETRPHLKAGDAFTIQIQHTRTDSSRPQNNTSTTTPNRVRVLEEGAGGIVLEWIVGATAYADPAQAANPIVAAAAKAVADMRLLIKLSPQGDYLGLQNEAEISGKMRTAADLIVKGVLEQIPQAQRAQLEAAMKQLLQPAVLLSSATREIQMYFDLQGLEITQGKPIDANVKLPNPVTGSEMPALVRIAAEKVDAAEATLSVRTTFDPAAVAAAIKQMASQAAGADVANQLPAVEVQDGGTYIYDRKSGLMRSVTYTRKVQALAVTRTDVWNFRLVTR